MIYVVDLAGGVPRKLGGGCCPGGWSADGRHLYVGDFAKVDNVARMSVPGGKREHLFEGAQATESVDGKPRGVSLGLTVSPDEHELLYSADQDNAGADIALFDFAKP